MEQSDVMSVEVERLDSPPVAVVRVRGELDFGTTPRLVVAVGRGGSSPAVKPSSAAVACCPRCGRTPHHGTLAAAPIVLVAELPR